MTQPQIPHDVDPVQVTAALDEAQQAQNQPVNDVAAAQAGQAPNPDNKVSISSLSFSLLVLSYSKGDFCKPMRNPCSLQCTLAQDLRTSGKQLQIDRR